MPKTPVIAVKIDDTAPGRPQVGIDKADVVYIEAVEGGLTRLAVVFGTNKPTVGYVRSTRPSDPDLLLQYGKITEAYSGGQRVSLEPAAQGRPHRLEQRRRRARTSSGCRARESTYINLELNLAKVAKKTKTNRPRSIGWTFDPSLAGLPAKAGLRMNTVVTGSYSSGTPVVVPVGRGAEEVRPLHRRGAPARRRRHARSTATNVIVQSCRVVSYNADKDVNGNPAQFTYTVGSGAVSVFRQGKRIDGTWSRPQAQRRHDAAHRRPARCCRSTPATPGWC